MSPLPTNPHDLTQWLNGVELGPALSPAAAQSLFEELYAEIKRQARGAMRRERDDHTLSATALVNEAWMRMAEQTRVQWESRGHFLAVASTMMRRILVNHELARRSAKRDADLVPLTLSGLGAAEPTTPIDVVAVHEALLAFESIDPRAAKVVELRFFGGLDNDEVANLMGTSLATVKRDWTIAKAWLQRELKA
jgi:RNA polymerase sigma factor (TIGR02999 family)